MKRSSPSLSKQTAAPEEVYREFATLLDAGFSVRQALEVHAGRLRCLGLEDQTKFLDRIEFSERLGLPIARTCRLVAERFEAAESMRRSLLSAFQAPQSTAKLVAWLPLLSLGVAQLAGLDPLDALVSNHLAQVSVALGAMLLSVGWLIMRRMLAKRAPELSDDVELLDVFADSLQSGLATNDCLNQSMDFVFGGREVGESESWSVVEAKRLVDFATANGVRLADLLRAAASSRRASNRAGQQSAIERLSVQLMIPLGLVVLPAFVLIGVAPVAIGMFARGVQ